MAQQSTKVFLDTSFFVSFIDRVDLNHNRTVATFNNLGSGNFRLYTSSVTVLNVFNRLEKELGSVIAHDFLQAILESDIQIIYPEQTDIIASFRFIKSSTQRKASLSEILNIHLMERNGIAQVLTYDLWHNLKNTSVSPFLS